MATNTVTTSWKKNGLLETDNPSGNKFIIYDATEDHGDLVGYGPKALMLSSLAGCSGLDIDSLLKKMRAEPEDFNIVVVGELTEEHPKHYHKVQVDYHFYGTNLKADKITKAVNLSVDRYCGVMEMFRQFATITTQIHLHENE